MCKIWSYFLDKIICALWTRVLASPMMLSTIFARKIIIKITKIVISITICTFTVDLTWADFETDVFSVASRTYAYYIIYFRIYGLVVFDHDCVNWQNTISYTNSDTLVYVPMDCHVGAVLFVHVYRLHTLSSNWKFTLSSDR